MIQSAAPSLSSSLALAIGVQTASSDDAAVSGDFAALLETTLATGQDGTPDQAAALMAATDPRLRQPTGNLAGKTTGKALPLDLPVADAAPEDTKPSTDEAEKNSAAPAETAPTLPKVVSEIVLPGLVVPISVPQPQADAPPVTAEPAPMRTRQSTAESLAQTARPAPVAVAAQIPVTTQPTAEPSSPALTGTASPNPQSPVPADTRLADAQPVQRLATTTTPTASDRAPAAPQPAKAEVVAASAPELPVPPVQPRPAVAVSAEIRTRAGTVRTTVAPASTQSTTAQPAAPQPGAALPVQAQLSAQAAATAKPAAPEGQQPVTAQTSTPTPQPNPAAARPEAEAIEIATPATTRATAEAPAAATQAPAAPPQAAPAPTLAVADTQAFSQSVAPVVAAPVASSTVQTGHDFAALVDRLVEAREAAMPDTVHAAVTHSEFGQVSLRFDQDARGLSVSMSSADPEFANAVQASASSAQSQTANDNGSNAPRQEALAQQQANGSPSGQSQASGRNDRDGQARTETRSDSRAAGQERQPDEPASTRGGIYA